MRRLTQVAMLLTILAGAFMVAAPRPAFAHGEIAQEAFIKTQTVTFYDVKFSKAEIQRNEKMTISGRFRVLNAWPAHNSVLPENTEAYISAVAPGPRVIVVDRQLGGEFAPGRNQLERGKSYDFSVTIVGRIEGRYHIHPVISFKHLGPLVGPGQWTTVKGGPAFKNPVQLASGKMINLETFGRGNVLVWVLLTILVGAAWLLYWLVPRPLLMRAKLLMTGDYVEEELVTDRDRKVGIGFAVLVGVILVGGLVYTKSAWPNSIPQQIHRFTPKPAEEAHFTTVESDTAHYTPTGDRLLWNVKVTNTGQSPVQVKEFTTSTVTFGVDGTGAAYPLVVEPTDATVNPGETKSMKLNMSDPVWRTARLLSFTEVQSIMGGLLTLEDAQGHLDRQEMSSELVSEYH